MKKILFMVSVLSLWLLLGVGASIATPVNPVGGNGTELSLQQVLNNITTSPLGASSVNVNSSDQLANDAYWSIGATGGAVSTIVIEIAGQAGNNTFGIFSGSQKVQVFSGGASTGAQAYMGIMDDGSVYLNGTDTNIDFAGNNFGFYLDTINGTFFSDTSKNTDQKDHMVAYAGKGDIVKIGTWAAGEWNDNEYVLAFEDTVNLGDWDYQDFVVMVESVNPVPEPASMLLLGLGLFGIGLVSRKKS